MSKNHIVWLKHKENLYVHNSSYGTVHTKIATKDIPNLFISISIVENVIMCDNV
jgi:hypothetical protein